MSKDSFQRLGASPGPAATSFTTLEKYTSLSYRIFRRPAGAIAAHFPNMHDDIARSDLNITPVGLVSVALLTTVLTAGAALGLVFAIFPLFPPIVLLLLAPVFPFMITLSAPRFSQANRSSRLKLESAQQTRPTYISHPLTGKHMFQGSFMWTGNIQFPADYP